MIRKTLAFFGIAALKAAAVALSIGGLLFVLNIFLPFGDLNYVSIVGGAFMASSWFTLLNATQKSRKLRKQEKEQKAQSGRSQGALGASEQGKSTSVPGSKYSDADIASILNS